MFKETLKTLSLFSGGGGLDLGFSAAGYSIMLSVDSDPYSCKTLKINSGKKSFFNKSHVLNEDISTVSTSKLIKFLEKETNKIDVVIGGPPCQAFSVFGRRKGLEDPRGNLVWEYLRIIKEMKPSVFVFENVDGIKTIHGGKLFSDLLEALTLNGEYCISEHTYNVAHFGIPQNRTRVFLIGVLDGKKIPRMKETHGIEVTNQQSLSFLNESLLPFVTVKNIFDNMDKPGVNSKIPNHIGRKHSKRIINRYASLRYGERDHKTRINKLHPDKPSFTIIVGSDAGGGKGHIHPFEPREVTPRESARIQTFPDWWEFFGNGRHIIRQVGNAVPPLFSALLAEHIKKHVFNYQDEISYKQYISKLELNFLQKST